MTEFLKRIHTIPPFCTAIISGISLFRDTHSVKINLVTENPFTKDDENMARDIARQFVPEEFDCSLAISKLTPDTKMVARTIKQAVDRCNKALACLLTDDDITVEKTEDGFYFTISVIADTAVSEDVADKVIAILNKTYCGNFSGKCVKSDKKIDSIEIEEEKENIEYDIPVRTFHIEDFEFIEGDTVQNTAIYLADVNFESENVVVCGTIEDIEERTYNRKSDGQERVYFSITINDTTAQMRMTYFTRKSSIEKIRKLKAGDSIVCTGKTEIYRGAVRYTARHIDRGHIPDGFVPIKRASKPAPKYYMAVEPQPYTDFTQADFFTKSDLPACLKNNTFVVFDLETTGLNSSPSGGNMDRIIEIGAYKIIGGEIKESFSTFVNPGKRLSEEIVKLTGITQDMVDGAPTYEQVMPDFFKFCQGCYLVGHNIAGFDFKFVDYYCAQLGYHLERKVFDTIPLSQELLFLSNYKLNTVADHFGITFNHHRAVDDALVTAKIFIELIKIKKSLPKPM